MNVIHVSSDNYEFTLTINNLNPNQFYPCNYVYFAEKDKIKVFWIPLNLRNKEA